MSADQALTVGGEGQEIDARIVVTEPFEKLARLRIPDKDAGGMNILASIVGHRDGATATDDPLTVRGPTAPLLTFRNTESRSRRPAGTWLVDSRSSIDSKE